MREQGTSGLVARIRRDLANAKWLAAEVEKTPGWELSAPVLFQTVCVRHVPEGLSGAGVDMRHALDARLMLDAHNQQWADRINAEGKAYLTSTVVHGRRIVRVSIGAEATELSHVKALWELIQATANEGQ